jgi:diguanylate cyclase (GGDEF)-like protein
MTLICVLVIGIFFIKFIFNKSQKSLEILVNFLRNASNQYVEINIAEMHYSEFKELAIQANLMIKERHRIEEAIKIVNSKLNDRVEENTKEIEDLNVNLNKKVDERTLKLRNLLNIDGLTQIYNYKYMMETLEDEIVKAQKCKRKLCIAMLDIDHFKNVNDNYGHLCGDKVLAKVASRLKAAVKDKGSVARYGGEEFMFILPNTNIHNAYELVDQSRKNVMGLQFEEDNLKVTISAGVVEYCFETAKELVKSADEKLYKAKKNGRNRIEV